MISTMTNNEPIQWYFVKPMSSSIRNDIFVNWEKYHLSFDWKYRDWIKSCDSCWAPVVPDSPLISLSSPESWAYVMWQSVWPIQLNATTTKMTNDIQSVTFKRWTSVINTINPAIVLWWLETYSDIWPFTTNQSWSSYVEDTAWLNSISNSVSINFANFFYRGMDPNTTIDETLIEWIENNSLTNTFPWIYSFSMELWSYKYFARPIRLWQPSDPTLDFIDNDTWFPIPFQLQAWVTSITNTHWFTEDYYVYRSVNVLWWILNIRIQP